MVVKAQLRLKAVDLASIPLSMGSFSKAELRYLIPVAVKAWHTARPRSQGEFGVPSSYSPNGEVLGFTMSGTNSNARAPCV